MQRLQIEIPNNNNKYRYVKQRCILAMQSCNKDICKNIIAICQSVYLYKVVPLHLYEMTHTSRHRNRLGMGCYLELTQITHISGFFVFSKWSFAIARYFGNFPWCMISSMQFWTITVGHKPSRFIISQWTALLLVLQNSQSVFWQPSDQVACHTPLSMTVIATGSML